MSLKPILYITATPIGSLADISAHAIQVLTNADLIICEDTRSTRHLLSALQIQNHNLESLHSNNEREKSTALIEKILKQALRTIALVSDAGTPAISDPGAVFVAKALEAGFQILNVPGPSSLVCALAASGFCHPRHIFSGFLPRNAKPQLEEFARWALIAPCIGVFFESPQRIQSTVERLGEFFHPQTRISISREISKKFEENIVLTLAEAQEFLENKKEILGEFVVCVEVLPDSQIKKTKQDEDGLKDSCKWMAKKYNVNAKGLYSFLIKNKSHE